MGSLRRHEGYLLINHLASPGTPEVPEGTIAERATITCCHCNRVFVPTPAAPVPQGYCRKCDHYTCSLPVCLTECNPFLQSVELAYTRQDTGQAFLLRGPRGEILFDPRLRDERKVY